MLPFGIVFQTLFPNFVINRFTCSCPTLVHYNHLIEIKCFMSFSRLCSFPIKSCLFVSYMFVQVKFSIPVFCFLLQRICPYQLLQLFRPPSQIVFILCSILLSKFQNKRKYNYKIHISCNPFSIKNAVWCQLQNSVKDRTCLDIRPYV